MFEKNRIYSIHFLRFFAAVGVVIHHIISEWNSPITVGAAGVDVFFVISGIVIGSTMMSGDTAWRFALKRIIRVIPMYWIGTILFAAFKHLAWSEIPSTEAVVRSIFLWPVFGTDWHPIYFPAWTLEYEMLFYSVAAVCMLLFKGNARWACLIFIAVASLCPIPVPGAPHGTTFALDLCQEFCAGMLIAIAIQHKLIKPNPDIGMPLIASAFLAFAINYHAVPLPRPISWGIPAAMLVCGALCFENAKWLRNRFVVLGGEASYAIYLTHVTVLQYISEASKWWHIPLDQHHVLSFAVYLVAAVTFGCLTCVYVERPLLLLLRRILLPRRVSSQVPEG